MSESIWDDINHELESIILCPPTLKYNSGSLTNKLYDIIDDKLKRRKILKENTVKGLYSDLQLIRQHRDSLDTNEMLNVLIKDIFKTEDIKFITSTDKLFINSYYRRLLRAKLENDFLNKEIIKGLVITNYNNHNTDIAITQVLQLLRFICKYLGIVSTTTESSFPVEKLYNPKIWSNLSQKFVPLFGEEKVSILDFPDDIDPDNSQLLSAESIMFEGKKKMQQAQVLIFLNIVFNTWSGSILSLENNIIKVVPATYINRLINKLK